VAEKVRVQSIFHPGPLAEFLQPAPNIKVFKGEKPLILSVSPGEVLLEGIKALPADRNPALFFRLLSVGKQEAALPVYIIVGQGQKLRYPESGVTKNGNQGSLHRRLAVIEKLLYFIKLKVIRDRPNCSRLLP